MALADELVTDAERSPVSSTVSGAFEGTDTDKLSMHMADQTQREEATRADVCADPVSEGGEVIHADVCVRRAGGVITGSMALAQHDLGPCVS